jgi:hypothetical protein
MASNPFHDLYLSETISEDALVELFSPIIVHYSHVMFEPGNVIVLGAQGTGKTMLLNLLRPESRLAYAAAKLDFPVPKNLSRFIGAGINLRKCGALEFAQQLEQDTSGRDVQELQLLFADFVNYLIVIDMIASVQELIAAGNANVLKDIGVNSSAGNLDKFAKKLAAEPCWFGALDGVENIEQLNKKFADRIKHYRFFINLNTTQVPSEIRESKTVIGDPILKAAQALREAGVLEEDVKVFIRIDQYEQLTTLNVLDKAFGAGCQQLIHKALSARDGRVSYRIGTRKHGWPKPPKIFKTDDVLELKRDFDVVDMEEIFRRRENSRTWIFPKFACDIFERRLKRSEYCGNGSILKLSDAVGQSLKPSERARKYFSAEAGMRNLITKAINDLPAEVTEDWKEYISQMGQDDILQAWLCCAWLRQKIGSEKKKIRSLPPVPAVGTVPWAKQPYWQKERNHQALMQIASAHRQALLWSGEDDLLALSGSHLLIFLFLLQHIWDAWLRDNRSRTDDEFQFPIDMDVQSQGVMEASIEWRSKQIEGPNARQRKKFVDVLGEHFYTTLINDKAMSYPGENGISISNVELEVEQDMFLFLSEAASFGDLFETSHTSKRKGEKRTKYYLAPILSPVFRIPAIHTKEPEYVGAVQVKNWLNGDTLTIAEPLHIARTAPLQSRLWSEPESD